MEQASSGPVPGIQAIDPDIRIKFRNLIWVALAAALMVAVIIGGNEWWLRYLHVITGLMWTGIDLFMGFVVGPIIRRVDPMARRAITLRLMPRTLFLLPTLSAIASTTGWFLADKRGFLALDYPEFWWVIAALTITTVLAVQGLGYLLPTNLRIYFEQRKDTPDHERIRAMMRPYFRVVASQGIMQMAIIMIMVRFTTGL